AGLVAAIASKLGLPAMGVGEPSALNVTTGGLMIEPSAPTISTVWLTLPPPASEKVIVMLFGGGWLAPPGPGAGGSFETSTVQVPKNCGLGAACAASARHALAIAASATALRFIAIFLPLLRAGRACRSTPAATDQESGGLRFRRRRSRSPLAAPRTLG